MGILHPKGLMALPPLVGDGSDGSLSTSGNVSLTSTLNGVAVVKQYTTLTVNSGHTLTVSNRCKGLHLYIQGDLVLNGTISMTARGASASNANQSVYGDKIQQRTLNGLFSLQDFQILTSLTPIFKNIIFNASVVDGAASRTVTYSGGLNYYSGNTGSSGSSLFQCGGGGSGAVGAITSGRTATSGRGGNSTFFSGGAGSGGAVAYSSNATSQQGGDSGGAGSAGVSTHSSFDASGGSGNPGGSPSGTQYGGGSGSSGTGGQLIVIVGGTISGSGSFESKGSTGGSGGLCGGGGSGGGGLLILYLNSTFSGSKLATGGAGGTASYNGGAGGAGYVHYGTINDFWNTYG